MGTIQVGRRRARCLTVRFSTPPVVTAREGRVGGQRVPRITEHFSNHPPPNELMSLSISSRSPATTAKQAWMMSRSAMASAHLARLTVAGHRAACSPSPALPRITQSPGQWSASQRHTLRSVRVMPLQQSELGTMRTPSPWASRPLGDPMFRSGENVLARLRCPIHDLQYPRWASPHRARCTTSESCTHGSQWRRSIDMLPTSVRFHRWSLGFGQFGSHRIAQALRVHAIHVF